MALKISVSVIFLCQLSISCCKDLVACSAKAWFLLLINSLAASNHIFFTSLSYITSLSVFKSIGSTSSVAKAFNCSFTSSAEATVCQVACIKGVEATCSQASLDQSIWFVWLAVFQLALLDSKAATLAA